MCRSFWCEHMVSEKWMTWIILVAPLAQHTVTVTSLCGLMWDFLQFSICYSENSRSTDMKPSFAAKQTKCEMCLPHTFWKYQFTKFSLALGCVLLSLWTTVFCVAGDANAAILLNIVLMMQICLCAVHVKPNVVEVFPVQHKFSWVILLCCMEPFAWKPFHIFVNYCPVGTSASGNFCMHIWWHWQGCYYNIIQKQVFIQWNSHSECRWLIKNWWSLQYAVWEQAGEWAGFR
jgi:hypothetical protein